MPQILVVTDIPETSESAVVYRERVALSDLESDISRPSSSSASGGPCSTPTSSNTGIPGPSKVRPTVGPN
jgi:hypothetical protein